MVRGAPRKQTLVYALGMELSDIVPSKGVTVSTHRLATYHKVWWCSWKFSSLCLQEDTDTEWRVLVSGKRHSNTWHRNKEELISVVYHFLPCELISIWMHQLEILSESKITTTTTTNPKRDDEFGNHSSSGNIYCVSTEVTPKTVRKWILLSLPPDSYSLEK